MTDEPFQLRNDPPKFKRAKFTPTEDAKQRMLFSGLDCLPGQADLWDDIDKPESGSDEEDPDE